MDNQKLATAITMKSNIDSIDSWLYSATNVYKLRLTMKFTKHHEGLIDKLQELCPIAFPKKPLSKVPLALGSTKVVQAILNVNFVTAEYLLKHWCQGKRYDKACSAVGTPRYKLDGTVAGKVSVKQAEFHKARLENYYRSRAVGAAKQEYWDDLHRKLDAMSDDEFMELLIKSGLERCPFVVGNEEDEQ